MNQSYNHESHSTQENLVQKNSENKKTNSGNTPVAENITILEKLLETELEIFKKICTLEQEKSEAIIKKNGELLQELSIQQEKHLAEISPLEKKTQGNY